MLRSLLVLVALTQTARADGFYFTEGFGGIDVKDELSEWMDSAVRIRIAGGMRRRNWAVEAWIAGAINTSRESIEPRADYAARRIDGGGGDDYADQGKTQLSMFGLDLKFLQPVAPHVELYLRGSMSKGFATGELDGYAGRGLGVGAGVQVKGKVPVIGFLYWPLFFTGLGPKVTGALWLDTGYDFYRLHGERRSIDAQLSSLTFGFAVGSDF